MVITAAVWWKDGVAEVLEGVSGVGVVVAV
jgi:hypothetical protein